jgi:Dehydrogenases with different specificities (related to short-chain alcohol dehydrogenases)
MYNPFTLEGKNILVTGASSGIGRAIAIECSKMGAAVILVARNQERLSQTLAQMSGEGHLSFCADLSQEEELDVLVANIPQLNGVVHCAGIGPHVPFKFVNKAKLDEVFSVNYFAPTLLSQKLLKAKKISKQSSIVFISSISGNCIASAASSIYCSTKAAIGGLVKAMAVDLAPQGIRVNSISPGAIHTAIFDNGEISDEQLKEEEQRYLLKRLGKPEEIAYATIYLLSDASAWTTGTNLIIDGGYTTL